MTYDYQVCGWRVCSSLELPQLPPWSGVRRPVDVTIVEGKVPEHLDSGTEPYKWLMIGADHTILLKISDLVRFLVKGGNSVTVEILRQEAAYGWRVFLLGVVLDYLCHQRRQFALHAACVKINGAAIAIAARSGVGKSTTALALAQRGHGLLSDDVAVLNIARDEGAFVLPTFPILKLWRDSCRAGGLDPESLPRVRDELEKVSYAHPAGFDPGPARLRGLVVLREGPGIGMTVESKTTAIGSILGYVSRPRVAHLLGRDPDLFAQAAMLSDQIEVVRLTRPRQLSQLPDCATMIEDRFGV